MADKIPDYNDFDLSSFDELPDFPESVQKPSYKKRITAGLLQNQRIKTIVLTAADKIIRLK